MLLLLLLLHFVAIVTGAVIVIIVCVKSNIKQRASHVTRCTSHVTWPIAVSTIIEHHWILLQQ